MCLRVCTSLYTCFVYLYCLLLNINVRAEWVTTEEVSSAGIPSLIKLIDCSQETKTSRRHRTFNVKGSFPDLTVTSHTIFVLDE